MNNRDRFYKDWSEARQQPRLTAASEQELLPRAQAGDQDARDELVRRLMRQVYIVIDGMVDIDNPAVDLLDLVQEGSVGLLRGLDRFNTDKNLRLSTYTEFWIWRQLYRTLDEYQTSGVRLPYYRTQQHRQLMRLYSELMQDWHRDPTTAELARESGLAEQDVIDILGASSEPDWLDDRNTNDEAPIDNLPDSKAAVPWKEAHFREVREVVDTLKPRERDVIIRRFGLGLEEDGKPRRPETLDQIGDDLGLTRERVRQIEKKALATLRKRIK